MAFGVCGFLSFLGWEMVGFTQGISRKGGKRKAKGAKFVLHFYKIVSKPQSGDILVELKIKMFLSPVGTRFQMLCLQAK